MFYDGIELYTGKYQKSAFVIFLDSMVVGSKGFILS